MRAKPRFQFGSHCDVIVARAARMPTIRMTAIRVSISVKPASPYLLRRERFFICDAIAAWSPEGAFRRATARRYPPPTAPIVRVAANLYRRSETAEHPPASADLAARR